MATKIQALNPNLVAGGKGGSLGEEERRATSAVDHGNMDVNRKNATSPLLLLHFLRLKL